MKLKITKNLILQIYINKSVDEHNKTQDNVTIKKAKVLFQKVQSSDKNNDYRTEADQSRIRFDKGRVTESRHSSREHHSNYFNDSSYNSNKRRVNFKHKGVINFSYSFLPGDVLTKDNQKSLQK